MAAGIGSRYGGLKQVDPVGPSGEKIIDYSVYDAARAGFGRVVFVIRREIEQDFREFFGRAIEARIDTVYAHQELDSLPEGFDAPAGRVKPWGTAHAVLCARDAVPGAFSAINADDFYGPDAFAAVGRHLGRERWGDERPVGEGSPTDATQDYCMAGYRLDHTLSEHGHVSRGVCDVSEDGFLQGIVERETIRAFPDGIKYESDDGTWVPLPGDTMVSMNIWGFAGDFFEKLDAAFRAFLDRRLAEPGAECYLPAVVNDLISSDAARVRVIPTDERWFGMTYREDRPAAVRAIRALVERGVYPSRLWV
jgi:choline kinase